MRATQGPPKGFRAKAYAGTTGVLLAMNMPASGRKGLLGFALKRKVLSGKFAGATKWLSGMINFPGIPHSAGEPVPTNQAPIQKFRWSDYTVFPDTEYAYTVYPAYGHPGSPELQQPGLTLTVKTLGSDASHYTIFNRAAAASQAFAREFPKTAIDLYLAQKAKKPFGTVSLPPDALKWLSRGLLETIQSFIAHTQPGQALDIAIYEYELLPIREAVADAANRGVHIRLLYHAKAGETLTKNLQGLKTPPLPKSIVQLIPRKTSKLMHNKFMVRSRLNGKVREPEAVLCGSTNYTENGVYRQANVVHIANNPPTAAAYLAQFERIAQTSDKMGETRKLTEAANPIDKKAPLFAGFSPRLKESDLDYFVDLINKGKRDVMFSTVFKQITPRILTALKGKPHDQTLRIGIQNSPTSIIGYHKDRTARFVSPALLKEGLEGWLKETTAGQKGTILIHTKMILTDFTSDRPTIISGSHNFTNPASQGNDENYLVIRCPLNETDVADAYGVELMRLYDHYRFRWFQAHSSGKPGGKASKEPPALDVTDGWTKDYYGGDPMKTADRERFCP